MIWSIHLHKVKQLLVVVSPFNGFTSSCHQAFSLKMPRQGRNILSDLAFLLVAC